MNSEKQEIKPLEKDNNTLFLENLMIREGGIYTFLGSKPMTEFDIEFTIFETDEEIKQRYEHAQTYLEKSHSKEKALPSFEAYKQETEQFNLTHKHLKKDKIWEKWLLENGVISNPLYKLTCRGKIDKMGLFVNIPNTIYILNKYYKDFAKITGLQFDISTILDSIDDEESEFWKIVFKNHYLFGLLLGFGEKNASLFDWALRAPFTLNSVSMLRFPELKRIQYLNKLINKENITLDDLQVPYFVSFEIDDPIEKRYLKEKEKIVEFLKDKEFIPFVLSHLNS